MREMNKTTAALILAGGNSDRMKFPKAFLRINEQTFLYRIVKAYADAGVSDIRVVMNSRFCGGPWADEFRKVQAYAHLIRNDFPRKGRFFSVKLGMNELCDHDYCFLQNADNPFVSAGLVEGMMNNRNSWGYTVPIYMGKRGHPVLLSRKVSRFLKELPDDDLNLRTLLSVFPYRQFESGSSEILLNVNTPEDHKLAMERMSKSEEHL